MYDTLPKTTINVKYYNYAIVLKSFMIYF